MAAQAAVLSFLLDAGWGDEVAPWGRAQLWKLPAYGPREAQAIPLCKKPDFSQKGPGNTTVQEACVFPEGPCCSRNQLPMGRVCAAGC